MGNLVRVIANRVNTTIPARGRMMFCITDMDHRIGKIRQSPCVVVIQMRADDVSDILWIKPQAANLIHRKQRRIKLRSHQQSSREILPESELLVVCMSQPGIDEDQSSAGFDEQTSTDQAGPFEQGTLAMNQATPQRAETATAQ